MKKNSGMIEKINSKNAAKILKEWQSLYNSNPSSSPEDVLSYVPDLCNACMSALKDLEDLDEFFRTYNKSSLDYLLYMLRALKNANEDDDFVLPLPSDSFNTSIKI